MYTPKDKTWKDAKGVEVPYTRTDALERLRERNAAALLKEALDLEQRIAAFKAKTMRLHAEVVEANAKRHDVDLSKTKGNHTWFSFARDVKVEADMQDKVQLDDIMVSAAHEKLMSLLKDTVKSEVEFLPELINSAFENTRGMLDTRKVLSLLGYRHKVKHTLFQEAMDLIEKSINVAGTKQYFRISELQEDGSYRNINLNFSK
jgi:hypothetical protein